MKDMKFQVTSPKHSEQIQEALFKLGAGWSEDRWKEVRHVEKPFLFCIGGELCVGDTIRFFAQSPEPEYIYRFALVEPRNGRPLLQEPAPFIEPRPVHVIVGGDMSDVNQVDSSTLETVVVPLSTAKRVKPKSGPGVLPRPPLGLRPRYIAEGAFVKDRIQEVRGAMLRYIEAQKEIPYKWVNEFLELAAKVEKLEEID